MEQFWSKKPGTHKQIIVGGSYIRIIASSIIVQQQYSGV